MTEFQVVTVSGAPYERGVSYGRQARELIRHTARDLMPAVLQRNTGLSRDAIAALALSYDEPIASFSDEIYMELRGVAAGAGIEWHEALMINAQKEIARSALLAPAETPQDCTSMALGEELTGAGQLVAQNIDMHPMYRDLGIILDITNNDGVRMLTWTVAGTFGQTGVNSHGLGRVGNGVYTSNLRLGVPSAVLTRKLLEQKSARDVEVLCGATERASSVNFLVADGSGDIVDYELTVEETFVLTPTSGYLVHTNHFCAPECAESQPEYPGHESSVLRLSRAESLIADESQVTPNDIMRILRDHESAPDSICAHEDTRQTVASCVLEPAEGRIHISRGTPCESPYQTFSLA